MSQETKEIHAKPRHRFSVLVCFGVFSLSLLCTTCLAEVQGDVELLRKLALMISENQQRIRFWQGSAQIEEDREGYPMGLLKERSRATFWVSQDEDAVRWTMTNDERKAVWQDGKVVTGGGGKWDEMKKAKTFYRYKDYFTTSTGERQKGLTIWQRDKADKSVYTTTFDPMYYFQLKDLDVAERLLFFYREADNPKLTPKKVTKEGNLVTVEMLVKDSTYRHTFDLSQGGNLTEYYADDGKSVEHRTWTYQQNDGVWLPKTFTFLHTKGDKDSSEYQSRHRKVTFVDNTVNVPIDPEEFTLKALGVKLGDPVSDTLLGLGYRYGGPPIQVPDVPADFAYKDATQVDKIFLEEQPNNTDITTTVSSDKQTSEHRDQNDGIIALKGKIPPDRNGSVPNILMYLGSIFIVALGAMAIVKWLKRSKI